MLGRYRLRERLGAGGFGVVWRAHDELLHREVAVKRIPLAPGEDGERATREALASARLAHPAIVALYEACPAQDAFYLISELVDGDTLARLIAEDALSDAEVLQIGVALCSALAHAHARGVIHRDVKPQNVLVPHAARRPGAASGGASAAVAKLTDFGGARLSGEDALTRTGDVLGTLAYMAPEQSEGREAGEAADLYSLALVLYEALSGVNPVRGATPAATVRRIGRPLRPLARARRDLPRELTRHARPGACTARRRARGTLEELRRRARAGARRAGAVGADASRAYAPARARRSGAASGAATPARGARPARAPGARPPPSASPSYARPLARRAAHPQACAAGACGDAAVCRAWCGSPAALALARLAGGRPGVPGVGAARAGGAAADRCCCRSGAGIAARHGRLAGVRARAGARRGRARRRVPGDRRPGATLAHARGARRARLLVAGARRAAAWRGACGSVRRGHAGARGLGGLAEQARPCT